MKTHFQIFADYHNEIDRPDYVSGQMIWDMREHKWTRITGLDGTTTTCETLREAEAELERAKEDLGYLTNARIDETALLLF